MMKSNKIEMDHITKRIGIHVTAGPAVKASHSIYSRSSVDGLDLRPASGIRAIACLGVMIGHCMFWVAGSQAVKLDVYRWDSLSLLGGNPAVESSYC